MTRREFLYLLSGPIFLPVLIGTGEDVQPQPPVPTPTPTPTSTPPPPEPFRRDGSSPDYYPFLIFDASAPLPIPTLQEIAGDAANDAAIVQRVVEWCEGADLGAILAEGDPARLRALAAMCLIHLSHSYGDAPYPNPSFVDYLQQPFSHCGPQTYFLGQLLTGLGLEYRRVWLASHAWVEARINGQWEIFDATSNTWINRSGFDLLDGGPRSYRRFYTPWSDITRPEFRQVLAGHEATPGPYQYTPGAMRSHLPGLGIYFMGAEYRARTGVGLVVLE